MDPSSYLLGCAERWRHQTRPPNTPFHPFRWLGHTSLQSMPVMVFLGCAVLPNERQATLVAAHLPLYRLPKTVIALQPGSLHDGKAEGSFCLLPNGNLLLTPMPSPESSLELALMAGAEPMAGVRPMHYLEHSTLALLPSLGTAFPRASALLHAGEGGSSIETRPQPSDPPLLAPGPPPHCPVSASHLLGTARKPPLLPSSTN